MHLIIYLYLCLIFLLLLCVFHQHQLPSVSICALKSFCLSFCSIHVPLFTSLYLLTLFPLFTLSSRLVYIPCRSPLISLKPNRHINPCWAPSGWEKNVGKKMVGILSWLNSIKCSDRAQSLRAYLQAASECPCCSAISCLMWLSVMFQRKVDFCKGPRFALKSFWESRNPRSDYVLCFRI